MDRREDRELAGWLARRDLKDPYAAEFTVSTFSVNNLCFYPVSELTRDEKSPSFTSFIAPLLEGVC